jgi:phenylalanyl-tRNA synthetase beta chain
MLVSRNWLHEYVNLESVNDEDLDRILTGLGLEVESVTKIAPLDDLLVVGEIVKADRHPNADTLQVCTVSTGGSENLQIVCGAANARAGIKVAVAQIGTLLPGNFKIKESKIRGEKSFGMLCSESELGLSEASEGILELDSSKPLGSKVNSFIKTGDSIFEISLTPNRSDCNGLIGIARDLAAKTGKPLNHPKPQTEVQDSLLVSNPVKVELHPNSGCERFAAVYISNIENGPSPLWLQKRLESAGMRPINMIVDITNYVMFEMNQPIHAYDERQVKGKSIFVRKGKSNETLTTIDKKVVEIDPSDIVICDAEGVIGLAGIMGGLNSEVKDDTKNIVVEIASFDPTCVRRTSKRHGFHTEASHRFERGVDIENILEVASRIIDLFVLCSQQTGKPQPSVSKTVLDIYPKVVKRPRIALRLDRARKILGLLSLTAETCIKHLTALEFKLIDRKDDRLLFEVPLWRVDVTREIDLIEEIARLESFDRIPYRMPVMEIAPLKENPFVRFTEDSKTLFAALGMTEVITYPFTSIGDYQNLLVSEEHPFHPSVELSNPLVQDHSWMQTTGIIGLLKATQRNHRFQRKGARLFEFGKAFHDFSSRKIDSEKFPSFSGLLIRPLHYTHRAFGEPGRPTEKQFASFILDFPFQKKNWAGAESAPSFFDAKQVVERLLKSFSVKNTSFSRPSPEELPFLHPTASAVLRSGTAILGWIGELHPKVAHTYGFEMTQSPVVCELDLESIYNAANQKAVIETETFEFPHALRDLAFTVEDSVSHSQIMNTLNTFKRKKYLISLELFDVFSGEGIPKGKKSMAYSLTFRAPGKTLQDQDVEKEIQSFMEHLTTDLGAIKR